MSSIESLTNKIKETRITYHNSDVGMTIKGAPFICEFPEQVDPESVCDTVRSEESPWYLFGMKTQLAEDYWKVVGTLFHIESGDVVDASKITFEVAPEWMRIYVKEECSAKRVAEFVEALKQEYNIKTKFVDNPV